MIIVTHKIKKEWSDYGTNYNKLMRELRKIVGGVKAHRKIIDAALEQPRKDLRKSTTLLSKKTTPLYDEFGDDRIIGIQTRIICEKLENYRTFMLQPDVTDMMRKIQEAGFEIDIKIEVKEIDIN